MLTFSVITPTVLRSTLLRTCRSLDAQRHRRWQHVVMVDTPEAEINARERALIAEVHHATREIHFCSEAHRDFGNTCRWNGWDFVTGDYVLYLDDDDYYTERAFEELQDAIAALRSAPVWGIFPVERFGQRFFNVPPGHSRTCSNQFFHVPRLGARELRYPKAGYCADGELIETLRAAAPYACVDPGRSLAVVESSNLGIRQPLDRNYFESAFRDYITRYSVETEAISLATSYYLWNLLSTRRVERVLDLGSGWSSFVFRLYKKLAAPDLMVCSVDDSEAWLRATARFITRHDLDTSHLHLWPQFEPGPYDVTLYDMARPWDRHEHLPGVLAVTRGALVCDDMHYENYRALTEKLAGSHGLRLELLTDETLDQFGRFAGIIERAA